MWGALSDKRTGLSFTIASGPRQSSHFRVRFPWDSWPYFTVSDSRLPVSSPPTTRRATVEVFEPPPHGIRSEFNSVLLLHSVSVSKEMFVDHSCPGKCVPYQVGFQESISTETCLSTRFLTMGLHVTIYTYQVEYWYRLSRNIKVLPQKNLRDYSVGTADGRDLWCTPLRWFRVASYAYLVSGRLVQAFKQYEGLASEIWRAVILVLLMEGVYEMRRWVGLRCLDIHDKFH
jgi:hypothetical protein